MTNKEKLRSIPLVLLVLFLLILSSSITSAGTETILAADRLVMNTAIIGNYVFWTESTGYGLHAYNIIDPGKRNYSSIGIDVNDEKINGYGNKVVWYGGDYGVHMLDTSTGNITNIAGGHFPDIYGNYIVYHKYDYDTYDGFICLYDLNTQKETQITPTMADQTYSYPVIYDKTVVWSQANSNNGYDIRKYDISTNQTSTITTINSSYLASIELDIYGNTVVWTESHNVYMYDMASRKITQITDNGNAYQPAIYGKRIVYTIGNPFYVGIKDIYMYDISSANTTRITTSTSASMPSIYGDRIVYADGRDHPGREEINLICLYDLSSTVPNPPVAAFYANQTSGILPLVVQFIYYSVGGIPTSWYWDFGDGINSTDGIYATHTFTKPGNYTISLTVESAIGNNTTTKPGYIVVTDPNAPVADFNSNVTEGYAPLTVQFNDTSQRATSRIWDFNNDGQPDSIDINPVYVYANTGTYTVNLTVSNANGNASRTASINVLTPSDSNDDSSGGSSHSSSSGSSGGGGAGGSPEPAKNVQAKELSQAFIASGSTVKFDFPKNATCVVYVSFDSKKTAGQTTTIAEQLKGKSSLVSGLPSGEVYKYFNVWVGNSGFVTSKNIENPIVCFKVEKSWLQDKKIDKASITLDSYSDKKWSYLPVKLLYEDDKYLYFTAETPKFSFFAITGKAVEKENVTELKPETDTSKPEQNNIAAEVGNKSEQGKLTSILGFGIVCVIVCLIAVFLHKRK